MHVLHFFPDTRDSYNKLTVKYREEFPMDTVKTTTIQRNARMVQCDLEVYPPSKRVRENRDRIHNEYRENGKKKESLWTKIKNLFTN